MKATDNENCIACGMCANVCSAVFAMGDDGYAHGGDFNPPLLDCVQEARDSCPVDAISIEE